MNCPACGRGERDTTFVLPQYRVVRCRACGLLYNGDFPDPEALADTFDEHYYRTVQAEAFAHVGGADTTDASESIYSLGMSVVERRNGAPARLLDVGCAFGSFLNFATSRGWQAHGVEISPYSSRFARERGFDVHTGDLSTYARDPGSFDVVTLWDVLEHVREAQGTLTRAARLLRPGGHLVLTTDDYRSLLSFIAGAAYRLTAGRMTYPIERFYIPFNSCYFTRTDVARMSRQAGLKEVYCSGIDYPIQKIKLSRAERLLLGTLYAAGRVLHRQSQFLMVLQKN